MSDLTLSVTQGDAEIYCHKFSGEMHIEYSTGYTIYGTIYVLNNEYNIYIWPDFYYKCKVFIFFFLLIY